jgi:pimeloyl-ACP methyl ester carboxylesterase
MRRKILLIAVALAAIFYMRAYCRHGDLQYNYRPQPAPAKFEAFAARQVNFSLAIGVPAHATEKLTLRNPAKDGYAILYIHGFGAGRAEGEAVGDALAARLNANIYYGRLPGHGSSAEAHAAATFDQYLQEMETTLLQMPKLGKKIILMGTSTGACVATWLAARHSDKLHAVILASPFWDFADKSSRLLNFPGGLELGQLFLGRDRDARWKKDPEKRVHPDYEKYWLVRQKFAALVNLNNLRRFVVRRENFERITAPVMGLIYYQDAEHKDEAIDIRKVRESIPLLKHPKNRLVEIADGSHILLSRYVRTDKARIQAEILGWLMALRNE